MPGRRPWRWLHCLWRLAYAIVGGAILILVVTGLLYFEFSRDTAEAFPNDPVKQFKYGSTGGDILAGLPVGIFKAMPKLCSDYLHGDSWEALGFIYDRRRA